MRWIFYEILGAKQSFERHDFVDTHTHLFWFYISLNLFGPRLVHDFYRFSMHVKEKTQSILNIGIDRMRTQNRSIEVDYEMDSIFTKLDLFYAFF